MSYSDVIASLTNKPNEVTTSIVPEAASLPIELVEQILEATVEADPSTYSALMRVSHLFNQMVHLRLVHLVPLVLTKHPTSFPKRIARYPEIAQKTKHMWAFGGDRTCIMDIIRVCPNIVSLACSPTTLDTLLRDERFPLAHCVDLTLIANGESIHWVTSRSRSRLFAQLQRIRLVDIGIRYLSGARIPLVRQLAVGVRKLNSSVREEVQSFISSGQAPALRDTILTSLRSLSFDRTRLTMMEDVAAWNAGTRPRGEARVHVVSLNSPQWGREIDVWYDQVCGHKTMLERAEELEGIVWAMD